jgi:hypothetical protein
MCDDPIVEEVRRIRSDHARTFDFNLRAMAEDSRKGEKTHPERLVSYPPRQSRAISSTPLRAAAQEGAGEYGKS